VARAAQRGQHVLLMTNRRILLAKADQALTRHGVFRSRL
jgi:hypothetical protein